MASNTKNLGQVAGVHIGSTPPENITLIWYDNTPSQRCHKVYDTYKRTWVIIDQKIVSRITYSELVNIAKNTGLAIGKYYQISDKGNVLAMAITSTKVQYTDSLGNILIDDLGTNIQYHVTSSNLRIDDVIGVFDETNKTLVFQFDEQIPNFTEDDYVLGKVKRRNVWSLAKYKLSSFLSTVTGNSITWNGGFFFNFGDALKGQLDKKGGVVSKDSYDLTIEQLTKSINNVGKANQEIIQNANEAIKNATSDEAIYNKKSPALETGGEPIDVAKDDSLLIVISKFQRYINQFKYATGIKLSQSFTPSEDEDVTINNNDTVETAFAKIQKSLNDLKNGIISIYGDSIKTAKEKFPVYNSKPDDITNADNVAQALAKLVYFVKHIETSFINDKAVTMPKIAEVGTLYTDIMRIEMTSNIDISDCGFGGVLVKGADNDLFMYESENPYNPYRLVDNYRPGAIIAFAPLTTAIKNPGNLYVTAAKLIHYKEGACMYQFQLMLDDDNYNSIRNQGYTTVKCVSEADIYGYLSTITVTRTLNRIIWFNANLPQDSLNRGNESHIIFKMNLTFSK